MVFWQNNIDSVHRWTQKMAITMINKELLALRYETRGTGHSVKVRDEGVKVEAKRDGGD